MRHNKRIYADDFDALGSYFERAEASDILISELGSGYLVGFLSDGVQRAGIFDASAMDQLWHSCKRAAKKRKPLRGMEEMTVRNRLFSLGLHLDGQTVANILIQESAMGFEVEYTTIGVLNSLVRQNETLDDARLLILLSA